MQDIPGALRRLTMRVNAMVCRSVINLVNDALETQRLQLTIMADEVADDVEHLEPYGLSFVPPAGADALALAVKGMRGHTVAICAHAHGERPTGNPPRTGGLYTDGEWRLFVDADGVVHVGAQLGAEPVALADKVDAEFKRIWDVLTDDKAVPASASASDAGEPGFLVLQTSAGAAAAQVQSVAATRTRAT